MNGFKSSQIRTAKIIETRSSTRRREERSQLQGPNLSLGMQEDLAHRNVLLEERLAWLEVEIDGIGDICEFQTLEKLRLQDLVELLQRQVRALQDYARRNRRGPKQQQGPELPQDSTSVAGLQG